MKFLTKEWSQQMSKKGFLLSSPQVNPQAAAFSEPFYQALYQEAQQGAPGSDAEGGRTAQEALSG